MKHRSWVSGMFLMMGALAALAMATATMPGCHEHTSLNLGVVLPLNSPPPPPPPPPPPTVVYVQQPPAPVYAEPAPVMVMAPPPALIVETPPPPPAVGYIWIGGCWTWSSGHYVWSRGHYDRPPYPRAAWVAPRYEGHGGGPGGRYTPGHWR